MQNNISGLQRVSLKCPEYLRIFLQLFILFYADDTILLAESEDDLQNTLTVFSEYCN